MDPVSAIGLVSSVASIALIAVFLVQGLASWMEDMEKAQNELESLVAEVDSTRKALGPLERYVRLETMDQTSQKVILKMMDDLTVLEDKLYVEIEEYLHERNLNFRGKILWHFKRHSLKEIANRISTQKITILALQVAELTHKTVVLADNCASQERALTEFLQTNPVPAISSNPVNGIIDRASTLMNDQEDLYGA